jgi:hypothetical protein
MHGYLDLGSEWAQQLLGPCVLIMFIFFFFIVIFTFYS